MIRKDRPLSVLVGPTDGINLILNMDKYKKMFVLVSLYHAVSTFHAMLLPTSVHYLGQFGKTDKLILSPQRFFERFSQTPLPRNFPIRNCCCGRRVTLGL